MHMSADISPTCKIIIILCPAAEPLFMRLNDYVGYQHPCMQLGLNMPSVIPEALV